MGHYAISGEFQIDFTDTKYHKDVVSQTIKTTGAKKISAMMVSAKPFHRVHERLIRTALV